MAQQEIILKTAQAGPCVIVGRRADQILKDQKNLLSVFICGSEEHRAERVAKRENIAIREAKQKMLKADRERSTYYNQLSEHRWGDLNSYDLCINTDRFSPEAAADLIVNAAEQKRRQK